MKIGFTTFCTENYKEIMDCLVDSVLKFSKHEITVFSINFNYIHDNPRVKNKRVDLGDVTYYDICKIKIISSLECDYDLGMVLDCDMIVTDLIDNIFIENENRVLSSDFPLFAKHPNDPFSDLNHHANNTLKLFTEKKPKMKYVYASFIFGKKNKWFLQEVLDIMNQRYVPGDDEMVINALLTKYEVDYDIGYNYLPNCYDMNVYGYLNNTISEDIQNVYLNRDCPVKFYTFHGHNCKSTDKMKEYINSIIKTKR